MGVPPGRVSAPPQEPSVEPTAPHEASVDPAAPHIVPLPLTLLLPVPLVPLLRPALFLFFITLLRPALFFGFFCPRGLDILELGMVVEDVRDPALESVLTEGFIESVTATCTAPSDAAAAGAGAWVAGAAGVKKW